MRLGYPRWTSVEVASGVRRKASARMHGCAGHRKASGRCGRQTPSRIAAVMTGVGTLLCLRLGCTEAVGGLPLRAKSRVTRLQRA